MPSDPSDPSDPADPSDLPSCAPGQKAARGICRGSHPWS